MKRKSLILWICISSLCLFGRQAEKAQDVLPAKRVELLALDQNDPRPYFQAELKFATPDNVKLPVRAEDLQKRIKVREAGSLFAREGREFMPFKVYNRATEGKLDVMMLFDLSSSMIASDLGGRSRIEAAKDAARVLVDKFHPGDRIAIALAILAGLWWGIPKIVWPATPLPHIPVRGGVKLPPSRNAPRSRVSSSAPGAPGESGAPRGAPKPRQGFEETRIYDNKSSKLRGRDDR